MANSSDNIQVAIRIRPLIKSEKEENLPIQWGVQNNNIYQIDESGQRNGELYSFDHIFQMCKSNTDIYDDIVKDFVDSSLNGLNSTIFAYGQTSSGKTYTMLGTENDRGLVPLAIDSILDAVSTIRDRKFLLRVSYVEIYNERINDLLDPSNTDVKIREYSSGAIGLQSVKEEIISSRERVFELLKIGARNRHMGSTRSNERSSRSHTIFKIVIESVEVSNFDDKDLPVQISSLNLVDLAGSERVAHTKATGMRLKEGGHINKSLSALGLVIRQLSDGQEFANFRDSKLTRLLQHSLGGNAKTLIICTITLTSVEFTNSTLSFAQRAKAVKNKPQINEVIPDSATCKHYALMNSQLKEKLEKQLKKNKDLERDKENNFKEISRLQEQMQMLEMFLHGKEKESTITIPKRRHTICHPVKTRPLKIIEEEPDDDTQNLEECTPAKRKIFTLSSEFTTPDCSNITDDSKINSAFSTPASVSRTRLQSLNEETASVKDDGSVYSETIKVEELDTQLDYESQTNSPIKNLQKLEEQLIVVQLNNKFKKREEELLNKISTLERQLEGKGEKIEEKNDISINADMQYLQDQLIILHGILESSKSSDSPDKNSCDQIIESFNSKVKVAKDMIQGEICKEVSSFEDLNNEPLVLPNELDSFKCLLNELVSFEKDLPSEVIYTNQIGDIENIKNLHKIYESLLKKNNLIRGFSEKVVSLEEELKISKKDYEKQLSDVKKDHNREKNDLQTTINKLDEERCSLFTALQSYEEHSNNQELTLLQEQITTMNRDFKKQIRNLQDSHDREKNDLKATIEKLREEKCSLDTAIEGYQGDRIRFDAKICELISLNDDYLDKIKSLEDTIYRITRVVGEYENTPEDENDPVAYVASLEQIKSEIDDYKIRSENETKALKMEIDRLNRLILEDKVTIDRLTNVVKDCKAKSARDTELLTSLQDSNNNYVDKIKSLEEKIESLEEEIKDLKVFESKTECLNCDIDRYKHQIKEYSAALEEFTDLNKKLKNEITRIQIKHESELAKNVKKSEEDLKKLQDERDIINEKNSKSEMLNDKLHQTLRNIIEKFLEEEKLLLAVKVLPEQKDSFKNLRKEMKDTYMNLKNQFQLFREKSDYDMEKINELLMKSCDVLKMFSSSEKQLHELDLSRKEYEISVLKEFNKNGCPNCNSMKNEIVDLKTQINSKEAQLTETLVKLQSSQETLLSTGRQSQENAQNVCSSCEEVKQQNLDLKKALSDKVCELFEMRSKWSKEKEKRVEAHRSDILDMYRNIEIAQNKKIAELENTVKDNEKKIEEFKKIIEVDRKTVAVQCTPGVCSKCQEIKKENDELRTKYEAMKVMCAGRKQEIEDLKRKLK